MKKYILFTILIIIVCITIVFTISSSLGKPLLTLPDFNGWFGVTPVEQIGLGNGLQGKLNGGLVIEQIENFKSDDSLPWSDDVFRDFYITETQNHVLLHRVIGSKFPNISFIKTSTGLVFDGVWGVTATIDTNIITGKHNFDTLLFNLEYSTLINQNKISFSNFSHSFCPAYDRSLFKFDRKNSLKRLYNATYTFIINNVAIPIFQDLTDDLTDGFVELLMIENMDLSQEEKDLIALRYLNAFATNLWQKSKPTGLIQPNQTYKSVVDISNHFVKFIPFELQENYPIPAEKQSLHGGLDFYPIYKCSVVANTEYGYFPTNSLPIKTSNTPVVEVISPPNIPVIENACNLSIKLNNILDSDLTNFDITSTPVVIIINDRQLIFNTLIDLNSGKNIVVENGSNIFYQIFSDGLVFNSYSGTITITNRQTLMSFDFTYQHGFVMTTIKLMQISGIDISGVDLEKYPVRVILNSDEQSYQFNFDNNSKLANNLSMFVKKGNYTYSILSNQLIFGSLSGNIEVTNTIRVFLFSYSVMTFQSDLNITLNYEPSLINYGNYDFKFNTSISEFNLIKQKLSYNFKIFVKVFNEDGFLLINKPLTYYFDGSTPFVSSLDSNNSLSLGSSYTMQILFTKYDESISYISNPLEFDYLVYGNGHIMITLNVLQS